MLSALAAVDRLGIGSGLSKTQVEKMRKAAERPVWRALRTFTYIDSSIGSVTIDRGEIVSDGHLAILRRPDHFVKETRGATTPPKPRATAPAKVKGTVVAPRPAQPAPKRREPFVRLSSSEASFAVRLPRSARLLIGDHAFAARGRYEICGGLFGLPAREGETVATIRRALAPGPATRSSWSRATMDLEFIRAEGGRLLREESDLRWVGSYHSHPSGDGTPSTADLHFWADDLREINVLHGQPLPHYVAVIVTPGEQARDGFYEPSWVKPKFHAWHVRAVGEGMEQFICSRADVSLAG